MQASQNAVSGNQGDLRAGGPSFGLFAEMVVGLPMRVLQGWVPVPFGGNLIETNAPKLKVSIC